MGKQGSPQRRQLLVRLEPPEPPEALGGLLHGGSGPTERHPGVPPAFDVNAGEIMHRRAGENMHQ